MLVAAEKAIYEATSVKQSYCECKTVFSAKFIESEQRSMCDDFKCLSSQVGMDVGLFHPCFFAFFSALYFYF